MMRSELLVLPTIMVVTVAVLSACSTTPEPTTSVDTTFAARVEKALEDARADGSDAAQIALLGQIQRQGNVAYEDVQQALAATAECMDANGLTFTPVEDTVFGLPLPSYQWSAPLSPPGDITHEQLLAIGEDCLTRHSIYVEMLYQTQPIAIEAEEQVMKAPLIACLRDQGLNVDESMTVHELTGLDINHFRDGATIQGEWAQYGPACYIAVYSAAGY